MEPHDTMRDLRAKLAKCTGVTAATSGFTHTDEGHTAWITAGDLAVETRRFHTRTGAVCELTNILRADTDGAIADVLDGLASEAEHGPITAEMLRTMARARRGL